MVGAGHHDLAARGLVEREPDPNDRRGVLVALTPRGRQAVDGALTDLLERERGLLDPDTKPGESIFDHHVYVLASDGDLQEGINHEAAALAGHLKLGKLIWLHDDNQIQLDTPTDKAESEDTAARFRAYGWNVLKVEDGTDLDAIRAAIREAQGSDRPTLIQVRTVIGFGSPRAGTSKAHGEPLGAEGVAATKQALGWTYPPFTVPDEVKAHMDATERGAALEADRTLGGLCDWAEPEAPASVDLPVEGAAALKAAVITVVLHYTTTGPLA